MPSLPRESLQSIRYTFSPEPTRFRTPSPSSEASGAVRPISDLDSSTAVWTSSKTRLECSSSFRDIQECYNTSASISNRLITSSLSQAVQSRHVTITLHQDARRLEARYYDTQGWWYDEAEINYRFTMDFPSFVGPMIASAILGRQGTDTIESYLMIMVANTEN